MDELDVHPQRFGHVAVERARADLHAQAGLGDQQVQGHSQRNAHTRDEQPVDGVGEGVGKRNRPVQHLGDGHAVHVIAPQDGTQLFKDVDQPEGQQHLVQVIAMVEVAEQQPFERQPKDHRQQSPAQDGQRQAAEMPRQRICEVGPQHVKAAVRQVHHAHDPEDQREPGRQHEQQQAVLHAVEQLDQEGGEVHRVPWVECSKSGRPARSGQQGARLGAGRVMERGPRVQRVSPSCSRRRCRPAPLRPRQSPCFPCFPLGAGRCPARGCGPCSWSTCHAGCRWWRSPWP